MRAFEVGSCMWLYSSAKKKMSAICSTWPWLYRETPITSWKACEAAMQRMNKWFIALVGAASTYALM
jgi:hypothetical protein